MSRDLAALLATQTDLRDTAPGTTIIPRGVGIHQAIGLLEQMAGAPLLASVQLKTGSCSSASRVSSGTTFAVAALHPDYQFWAMSVGNLIFTLNVLWSWRLPHK